MNEDKARDIYKAHEWYDESLQEMAARIVVNWPHVAARADTIRALIALDRATQVVELEARRADYQRQSDGCLKYVKEIDAKLAALRGES